MDLGLFFFKIFIKFWIITFFTKDFTSSTINEPTKKKNLNYNIKYYRNSLHQPIEQYYYLSPTTILFLFFPPFLL